MSLYNENKPWSDLDINDLVSALEEGQTTEEIAVMLFRSTRQVRVTMERLGLREQRSSRNSVAEQS